MKQAMDLIELIPSSVFTWTTFFSAGIILFILRYRNKIVSFSIKDAIRTCIPFDPLRSQSFHTDLKIYIIRKLTDFVFLIPGAYVLFLVSNGVYDALSAMGEPIASSGHSPARLIAVACTLIIAAEFNAFLWHYIEHKIPFLWELHKVHHSADNLNPLTNKRSHSFVQTAKFSMNGFISGVPTGLFMYYYGFGFVELLAISAIANKILTVATLDVLRHSHVPLRFGLLEGMFISPHMHQIHHSSLEVHWDKNFGTNLAIFDWMFGTAYRPQKGEDMVPRIYGYSPEQLQQFNSLKGTYWDPLARSFETLKRSLRGNSGSTVTVHLTPRV
jgi:sterol desaturase/sphingolipid hydroxylase (fatty acid hydroxylase superfamily)